MEKKAFPTFETDRLILRAWEETDAESLYEYAKDERVGPVAGWPVHTSVENSQEIIRTILSEPGSYAVCLKEDNRAIGAIGLTTGSRSNLDLPDDEGEIGYWIGVPFWGQGLIPEGVRAIIRHGFEDLDLTTLWCGYFEGNEKSRRVQEKCGFVYHHTNKDVHWKQMDDIRTEHITRLLREEWEKTVRMNGEPILKSEYIAYCGLDCEACEARLATVRDDNELRQKVAKEWSELNGVEITPEMINCAGCRISGVKTPFCDSLCPIRQCALGKAVETCGDCSLMETCEKLGMITGNNTEALRNLKA